MAGTVWEAGSSWKVQAAGAAGGPSCCGWQTERKRTPRPLGMTDREATERCNDWHGGKRAAFGKRRQRGLREGRAAMGGKGLGQGDRDGTQQTPRGMMTGAVGSK